MHIMHGSYVDHMTGLPSPLSLSMLKYLSPT